MDEDRPFLGITHVAEHRQQVIEIVPVDRPDIEEAELLEQRAAGDEPAGIFLHGACALLQELGQPFGKLMNHVPQRPVGPPGDEPRQIGRQRTDRRGDRHVVVV